MTAQQGRAAAGSHPWARALYTAARGNAQAFGFSITVTVTFQVVSASTGRPSWWQVLVFALAAVAAFSVLNLVLATVLDLEAATPEAEPVVLVSTATDFAAVGAGIGAALGSVHVVAGGLAWGVTPFCAGLVYLAVQAVELRVGRRAEAHEASD